ncbi:hypothetical protein C6T65_19910 [Burkholderia vietnamiensis]|uniref:Uncharacterized protein n=1 Tax=Burkholderia vietnamiensis TaxID=60552 RepID=A0AA45BBK8_BURVI|nr:hypothetical protein C6T65_19910 [Burkholderia vietnamiensis]RQM53810.1 hypothetical protein EHZ18_23600 [Burkholderia vietnamiensis]
MTDGGVRVSRLRDSDIVLRVRRRRAAAAALPSRAARIGTIAALRLLRRINARHRDGGSGPALP